MIILDPVIHYPLLLWDSLLQFPYKIMNCSKDGAFYAVGVSLPCGAQNSLESKSINCIHLAAYCTLQLSHPLLLLPQEYFWFSLEIKYDHKINMNRFCNSAI